MTQAGAKFEELVAVMARLRAPGGCPWDREQTFDTLKSYLLEETYEVLDAVDSRDWAALAEELGDLLLQPVFLAEIAAEKGVFTIADALDAINRKLVRRHPHVFGDAQAKTPDDVKVHWDAVKQQERSARPAAKADAPLLLDSVPRALPALVEADKIGRKVAQTGFDWPDTEAVFAKLDEEAAELKTATTPTAAEHEIGDLLFNAVNLARHYKVDPEQALRKANARFRNRFAHIERTLGAELTGSPLARKEQLWQEAKQLELQSSRDQSS